ncbi:MAG TPA: hypothetical protein VKU36_04855 [Candidatus Babeliales bacterium]|nr:hypothetical protein [Candidatus Babeliales bacterium]
MTIKQGSLLIILFSFINNFSFDHTHSPFSTSPQPKDFVFEYGIRTRIHNNNILQYLEYHRVQGLIIPAFRHIRVMELTKDKKFKEVGTLGSLEKEKIHLTDNKFIKHAMVNNAIYCGEVELAKDYDGKLYPIGAIVYRTQDLENCALVKEYIEQQKAAQQKTENVVEQK